MARFGPNQRTESSSFVSYENLMKSINFGFYLTQKENFSLPLLKTKYISKILHISIIF